MNAITTAPAPFATSPALDSNAYVAPSTKTAVDRKQGHMSRQTGKVVDRFRALTALQTPNPVTGRLVLTGGDTSNGLRAFLPDGRGNYSASATINRMLTTGASIAAIKAAIAPLVKDSAAKLGAHLSNLMFYGQRDQLVAGGCVISNGDSIPATLVADGGPVLDRRHAAKLAKADNVVMRSPLLCVLHNVVQPDVVVRKAGKVVGAETAKAAPAKATKKATGKATKKAANA